jgi:Tol biopolymer transport system component
LAEERLADLTQQLAELRRQPTFTKIEIASKPQNGVLSPDGNRLAFVSDGGVWVLPVHGNVSPDIAGAPVRIADVEGAWDSRSLLAWSGDGRWIAVNGMAGDEDVVYVVPAAGGEPRVIHTPTRGWLDYSHRLTLSPEGGTLAFSALGQDQEVDPADTQNRFIYSVSVSGGEPRQLTGMTGHLPAFSPDGQTIAYVSIRRRHGGFESDLWLVPASGGQPVKVISSDSGRIRGPVWSPRGDFIAAHHEPGLNNSSAELWVTPLNSTDPGSSLIKIPLPNTSWNMLAGWTPDDRLGVFLTTPFDFGAAYTVPATGGKVVRVTPEHGSPSYLAWSPDGARIYLDWQPRGGDADPQPSPPAIGSIPAGGGEVTSLALAWGWDRISSGGGLDLSPDGTEVVFMGGPRAADRRPGPEDVSIWTASVDGAALTQLTAGPVYDAFPRWSPDGRWIAFLRLEEERDNDRGNIQLIPSSGGEIRQITSNVDSVDVAHIAFSPDGTRIAYFSGRTIKVVPVQGGQSEVLLTVGSLVPFPELAWSPDGSRIAHASDGKIWVDHLPSGRRTELATGLSQEFRYLSVAWSPDGEKIAFVAARPRETEFWLISDFLPQER